MPPFNGSGSFSTYTPGNPVIPGTVISSTAYNATQQDIAAGLSNAVTRDGQSPLSANLPAAGRKITGLGAGVVAGDSLRFEQLFSQGTEQDIASAATVDIGGLNTTIARITGTTTITSFGTNYNGPRFVRFADVLTLTHNGSTLSLPGFANITTAAGDRAIITPLGNPSSGWLVVAYQRAALAPGEATTATTATTANNVSGTVAIANGGTSSTTAAAARTALGTNDASNLTTGSIAPALIYSALNATGVAPLYACRAWVNFNGTGAVAIRASGNVSSITDNGVGDYTVNLLTALPDANFSAVVGGPNGSNGTNITTLNVTATTASTVQIVQSGTGGGGGGNTDSSLVSLAVFR